MKNKNSRLTIKREVSYNTMKRAMKSKNHPIHLMKKQSTTVEEIFISGSSMKRAQKRRVFRFVCVCKEVDVFYRQVDHSDMFIEEYTKPVKSKIR